MSKTSTLLRTLVGLILPVYGFFLVLFHDGRLEAAPEIHGIRSPHFNSCSEVQLLEEGAFNDYLRATGGTYDYAKVQPFKKKMLTPAMIRNSPEIGDFFKKTRTAIHQYLEVSAFHAEYLKGCIDLLQKEDGSFFSDLRQDPEALRGHCAVEIQSLVSGLEQRWSPMRIALSLSRPRLRENRLLNDESLKIHGSPQHTFPGVPRMARLSPAERAEALRQFDRKIEELRLEFRTKYSSLHPRATLRIDEDNYVVSHLDRYREEQKKYYHSILEEMPALVYVTSNPSSAAEISQALVRVLENSRKALASLNEEGAAKPALYAGYPGLIDEVLSENRQYCGLAHGWLEGIQRRENIYLGVRIGINVVTLITGTAIESAAIRFGAELLGTAIYASYVYGVYKDYELSYAKSLSSVLSRKGVADLEHLEADARKLLIASVFIPLDAYTGTRAALEAQRAAMQFLRSRALIN